ncbi:MAG: hypothetical protein PF630_07340 [Gammaproteobacteria bacterium]|jgi:hypothetical protein|nr:hypothetical protein [Gammaproteobacteria bacterium]
MKIKHLTTGLLVLLMAGTVLAQSKSSQPLLRAINGTTVINSIDDVSTVQGGGVPAVGVDMTGIDSWDGIDDTDNIIIDLNIGAGNAMTGVSWDVGIATVGASWLSEPTVLFSDSTGSADPNGISLAPGTGVDAPGDMEFSSGGVLDFSDNALPDIVAGADGILRLQFFEGFDDTADAVDANWRNAVASALVAGLGIACTDQAACDAAVGGGGPGPQVLPPAPAVPTLSLFGLLALALVLVLGTVLVLRRKA